MSQKRITKTFMMISNKKKTLVTMVFTKQFSFVRVILTVMGLHDTKYVIYAPNSTPATDRLRNQSALTTLNYFSLNHGD